jgi:hypothetical protein
MILKNQNTGFAFGPIRATIPNFLEISPYTLFFQFAQKPGTVRAENSKQKTGRPRIRVPARRSD